MNTVLKSMRLHIGILGKRNVGKSSLLNFITEQNLSIVSEVAGTTTDVVEKVIELLPIGPAVFFDTAGIDDAGTLGEMRVQKTYDALDRLDIALVVCDYNGIGEFEKQLFAELSQRQTPFAVVVNKNDEQGIFADKIEEIEKYTSAIITMNTRDKKYLADIKQLIIDIMPKGFFDEEKIFDDIVKAGDIVVLVVPIDKEAPVGRLILPQVRTIRNMLDNSVISVVTGVDELKSALDSLKQKPSLVITDSQVFSKVFEIVPDDIYLTSYSIAFARLKGDLQVFVKGAEKISELRDGDKVLICESCTHHSSCEDIGRVKIPNLLRKTTGKNLIFDMAGGHDWPKDIEEYSLIIHCGGCMTNKKEVLSRIIKAQKSNVPITNYGISIAYCLGILDRAIKCFGL